MHPRTLVACCLALAASWWWSAAPHAQWNRRPYQASRYGGNYMHTYHFGPAPSSTPWAPAWAPDGRSLAVSMAGSIWRVDVESGAATELTSGPAYHSQPAWSPDGRWIVYTADDGGTSIHLEILDVQAGTARALTTGTVNHADPEFSPDGRRLAYTASLPNGYFNVFVQAVNDGQLVGAADQVTTDGTLGRDRPYFTAQDMHVTPTWASDGRSLVLVSNRGVALGSGSIVRMPAEAGGWQRATPLITEQTLYHARPDESPDGTRLVFVSADSGKASWHTLSLASATGGPVERLDLGAHDSFTPAWSPDGRSIAFVANGNASGLPQLAILDVDSRRVREVPIAARTWKRPAGCLVLQVRERGEDAPIAARIHLRASDGRAYAPPTQYARVTWAGDRVFHTAGDEDFELPAGPVVLDVVSGFERAPVHVESSIDAGGTRTVRVELERVADMAARGWYSGSTGAHVHGAGLLRYAQEALLFQAAGEDLDVVNNALAYRDERVPASELFRWGGPVHRLSRPDRLLVLGQEYRPPFHGHVAVFGDTAPLPLFETTIGYEGNPPPTLAPSNTAILKAAKARGAITGYVHAFSGEGDPIEAGLGLGKAFMVDAALGTADTIEWAGASRGAFAPWYAALNNGLRVTAIGGEDTIANLHMMRLLGCVRTYVHTGGKPLSADAWWDGVRRGRTVVTTGPLIEFTVSGAMPGDDVKLPAAGEVMLAGQVTSVTPLQRVIVVANGVEVARVPLSEDRKSAAIALSLPITRSGWIHVRAEGVPADRFPFDTLYAQAFTNPIWVSVAGAPVRDRASAEYALKWIDMLQLMADAWPGWNSADEKAAVFRDFAAARDVYRRFAAEAPAPSQGGAR